MELQRYLDATAKTCVTLDEITAALQGKQPDEVYAAVQACVAADRLSPMKRSGTNGSKRYPLWLRYRKLRACDDALMNRLYRLHAALLATGYLQKHPEEFRRYEPSLTRLSSYLLHTPELHPAISRKERSFAIFGQEKQLDDASFCRLLNRLNLDEHALAYYDTPTYCFCDCIAHPSQRMTLLLCENKDIWFNLRRMLLEEHRYTLLGEELSGVVYGQGNYVTRPGALEAYTRFLQSGTVRYLYWGDLDREGLRIYLRLKAVCPQMDIQLFLPGYEAMLTLLARCELPKSEDDRGLMPDAACLLDRLTPAHREAAQRILGDNLRLPQEIVTFSHLQAYMR